MATEIAHEPASARKALGLNEGTDVLSGILARQEPAEETTEEHEETIEEPETEASVQESETEEVEETEAEEAPATEEKPESEVTSEIELEPAQVAELLGLEEGDIDVDEDGALQFHAKVDGKPAKVALRDLRHSYELAQTHEERLRQLGRERKAFQEESQATLERMTQQQAQFGQAVKALEEEYASDFQSVDWTTLRNEDPTEYNAKRMDYEDRRKRVEEYKAQLQNQSQQLQQEHQTRLQAAQSEGAMQLAEAFQGETYRNAPAWGEEESQKLAKWIVDQGFSQQDVASVGVWQVFKWARDSMLREQELKQAKDTVRKVTRLTKVTKPGKAKPASAIKKAKTTELKTRQRKSGGGLRESTDLIRNILNAPS